MILIDLGSSALVVSMLGICPGVIGFFTPSCSACPWVLSQRLYHLLYLPARQKCLLPPLRPPSLFW